jgi:hypothetical protein
MRGPTARGSEERGRDDILERNREGDFVVEEVVVINLADLRHGGGSEGRRARQPATTVARGGNKVGADLFTHTHTTRGDARWMVGKGAEGRARILRGRWGGGWSREIRTAAAGTQMSGASCPLPIPSLLLLLTTSTVNERISLLLLFN